MSRQAGETILIGDDIEIVIAHIGRSRVKVGIRAPRHIPVVAKEVKLVRSENAAAAVTPPAEAISSLVASLHSLPLLKISPRPPMSHSKALREPPNGGPATR
jgi:carbon storage regulator